MALLNNPLRLNNLQLKTLALFQELSCISDYSNQLEDGGRMIQWIPSPHGDHFHIGSAIVKTKDATGLNNENVWNALERKALIKKENFPRSLVLTRSGQDYITRIKQQLILGSDC